MADYPDLYPFVKVSVWKSFLKERYMRSHLTHRTEPCFVGSVLSEPYPRSSNKKKDDTLKGWSCQAKGSRERH